MAEFMKNFCGYESVPLSVTTVSASVRFALPRSPGLDDALIYNAGSSLAYVAFGNSNKGATTATLPGTNGTTKALPVPPGAFVVYRKNFDCAYDGSDTVAAITPAGTTNLVIVSGQGS